MVAKRSRAERVMELCDRLERWCDLPQGDRLFESVLPELGSLVDAECCAAFSLESDDGGGVRLDWSWAIGFTPESLAAFRATGQRGSYRWAYNPLAPGPEQANRAIRFGDLSRLVGKSRREIVAMNPVWRETGLAETDMLRVHLCDGPAHLAWIGTGRNGSFSDEERDTMQSLVPALQRRLRLERILLDTQVMRTAFEALLEHVGAAAVIVDARGRAQYGNAVARAMWADLRGFERSLFPGTLRIPLPIRGLPPYELVIAQGRRSDTAARVAEASRRFRFTRRQAQVLELLCAGHANKTIASLLCCSVKTVELHVSAMLKKAGAPSRSSLVAETLKAVLHAGL
jgi:DNA-binding CsgD family transcriptional regulator